MRYRLAWPLAGVACLAVLAGVAALWHWEHTAVGVSVGVPVAATLLAPLISWAFSAQRGAGRPTAEQSESARQAVADAAIGQWRQAAEADPALAGGAATLEVHWTQSAVGSSPGHGSAGITALAARLRQGSSGRLIVLGAAGSGKTTLARLLVAELLKQAQPGDQVPVLLPVSAWNPDREGLYEWMVRSLAAEVPGLGDVSSYGPAAAASLVNRGMVLPILDGLDVLPEASRRLVLDSADLLVLSRFVLTCREEEFRTVRETPVADAVVLTPGRVPQAEMMRFLRHVTDGPGRWDELFGQLTRYPDLAEALAEPRIIYLASTVYRDGGTKPAELISPAVPWSRDRLDDHLVRELISAHLLATTFLEGTHWPADQARKWLGYLATLGPVASDDSAGGIAWWQLYRAMPWLCRWQAQVRASLGGLIAWLLVSSILSGRYGQLTGLAYGAAIFTACLFLSSADPEPDQPPFRPPAWWWWLRVRLLHARRVIVAGLAASCSFGFFIGLRVALNGHLLTGIRAGVANGLTAGMIVVLAAIIARIPTPPRGELAPARPRPKMPPIGVALALGVSFGLLSGLIAVYKHQGRTGPDIRQGLLYGLVMGLDFGVGTWLARRAGTRFAHGEAGDPLSDFRSERAAALLVPIILGLTFSSAFGLSAELTWSVRTGIMNGAIGILVGGLTSDLSLYLLAVVCLGATKQLPFRTMTFLERCRLQGILRPVLQTYRFAEDPRRLGLIRDELPVPAAGGNRPAADGHVPAGDRVTAGAGMPAGRVNGQVPGSAGH